MLRTSIRKNWIPGSQSVPTARLLPFTGKCDFGQGIFTAQTQLVAEELSLAFRALSSSSAIPISPQWSDDTILPFGIYTMEDRASVPGHTFGNVVYVVARSTPANSPTFTISIDGTTYGPYATPVPWTTMRKHDLAPYSVRIGNLADTYHSVTIQNRGSGELHVDFIAGNKGQLSPTGPYLYAITVYKASAGWEFTAKFLNDQIRTIATQLAADGLGIVLADVEGDCANPNMVDGKTPGGSNCSQADGVHPNDAGH
jgi:hypothetical protein